MSMITLSPIFSPCSFSPSVTTVKSAWPLRDGGEPGWGAADRNRFDVFVGDADFRSVPVVMAKSAEVPGMCTAAARPFEPSGDLMFALPMMK